MSSLKSVCIFCGARLGANPAYREAAEKMASLLAREQIQIVYGGGHAGLMGVVADAALAESGQVIGVIPEALEDLELAHEGISQMHVVKSMHERKALMAKLSDGFIALPGGFGTLDELCEIITWMQLDIHSKPIGILNVDGFFDSFLSFVEHAVQQKFISENHSQKLIVEKDPQALWTRLQKA